LGKILYIINPAGSGGKGGNAWKSFLSKWPEKVDQKDIFLTEHPGHARQIARSSEGYEILVAAGGDGTIGEIISAIMQHPEPRPKLAIVPAGTGNDIARNIGVCSIKDSVDTLRKGHWKAFDLIRIDCQVDGRPMHQYAFLYVSVGFTAASSMKPWMKRFLSPKAAYYLGLIIQIVVYQAPLMTVHWEKQVHMGKTWVVVAGNVERVGGNSMCIAPGARMDDGKFNVSIVPSQSRFKMMVNMLPKVPAGTYVEEPGVSYFPAKEISVDCDPPAILDIDGDIFGRTPARFTVCPSAIQILSPE